MSSLIEKINSTISRWDMRIRIEEIFDGSRQVYVIQGGESARKEIQNIELKKLDSVTELIEIYKDFEIIPLELSDKFENYKMPGERNERFYDCRDWAFDKAGLPQLTFRQSFCKADILVARDLHGVTWIPDPEEDAIVMYFNLIKGLKTSSPDVKHWGILSGVNGRIIVQSKWGKRHVYEHPLEMSPAEYGDHVFFFRNNNSQPTR